jgi:UDP-2-acetamido-3-amino-2,3-dideoxy-glucuronate N-acetyltransferase
LGENLVRNFHSLNALCAVCDSDVERLETFTLRYPSVRIFDPYSDVLRDETIRGMALATPAEAHAPAVREALLTGKDVIVEKPLYLSVEEGENLVDLAKKRDRNLMVGHLLWYHPAVLKLNELIAAGESGRLLYTYFNRLNLGKIRREENILWSFAAHSKACEASCCEKRNGIVSCWESI